MSKIVIVFQNFGTTNLSRFLNWFHFRWQFNIYFFIMKLFIFECNYLWKIQYNVTIHHKQDLLAYYSPHPRNLLKIQSVIRDWINYYFRKTIVLNEKKRYPWTLYERSQNFRSNYWLHQTYHGLFYDTFYEITCSRGESY